MVMRQDTKNPGNTTLDWSFNWNVANDDYETWLGDNEIITEYEVTIDPVEEGGLTVSLIGEVNGIVTAWLTGGILGKTYLVTCKIKTSNDPARIDSRSLKIKILIK